MSNLTTTRPNAALGKRAEYFAPTANLHQDSSGYTLEVEMPGVSKENVQITVEDGRLILAGHRAAGNELGRSVHRERKAGDYRRVFDLDPSIDVSKIGAQIEQGLLTVHLPKAEAARPRKITVG
jgi:HSP20 family protein